MEQGESRLRARPKGFPIALWKPSVRTLPYLIFFRGFSKREGSTFVEEKCAFDAELTINHMKNKNTIAQTGILCYTERG